MKSAAARASMVALPSRRLSGGNTPNQDTTDEAFPLLQLPVLRFGLLQDGDLRVRVFPRGEEVLVGGLGRRRVSLHGKSAPQSEMRECVFHGKGGGAAVVENAAASSRVTACDG